MIGFKDVVFCESLDDLNAQRHQLNDLSGRTLIATYSAHVRSTGEWFSDGPLLLQLTGTQLGFWAIRFEIGLTRDAIDVNEPFDWFGDRESFEWRKNRLPILTSLIGRKISDVFAVENDWGPLSDQTTVRQWFIHGVQLRMDNISLQMFNAGDEVGISIDPADSPAFRATRIA